MKKKKQKEIKEINIALICDTNYIMPTAVTIQSIISNVLRRRIYNIFVIAIGIEDANMIIFERLNNEKQNVKIKVIKKDFDYINKLYNNKTIYDTSYLVASTSSLAKFKLASLLPQCQKVLYLDSDLIVKADLSDLFSKELYDNYAGVVRDLPQILFQDDLISESENNLNYFNSGVMLLNLEQIRCDEIEKQLIQAKLQTEKDTLMDQNVLNYVFGSKVIQFSIKYNVCYTNLVRAKNLYTYAQINTLYHTDYNSLLDIYTDAIIIHYSSKMKPWYFWDTPLADEWLYYYRLTPFENNVLFRTTKGDRISVEIVDALKEIEDMHTAQLQKEKYESVIPIVFAANATYAPYAAVAIQSIIANSSDVYYYDIYILHDEELLNSQKCKLLSIVEKNYSVQCIDVRKGISTLNLYSRAHYSKQMYYRFLIPEIFTFYEKILYLDCDTILKRDVANLYFENIGNNVIGAVNNFVTFDMFAYLNGLNIPPEKYINSGVLIINCNLFIKYNIKRSCFECLSNNDTFLCPDQDAINIVCKDKIFYLNDNWNFQWHHQWTNQYGKGAKLLPDYTERYKKSKEEHWLIHYTSGRKPWKKPEYNYADLFWYYAKQTLFYEEILYKNINEVTEKNLNVVNNAIDEYFKGKDNSTLAVYICKRIDEKDAIISKLQGEMDFYKDSLWQTRSSISYKIGRFITFFPRLLRFVFWGKSM